MERWKEFNYILMQNKSLDEQALEILKNKMYDCDNIFNKNIRYSEMYADIKEWLQEEWCSKRE